MFKKRMIETSIGKISKDTLKYNKDLIRRMFMEEREKLSSTYTKAYDYAVTKMEEYIRMNFGEYQPNTIHWDLYKNNFSHTKESIKILNDMKKNLVTNKELLKNIDRLKNIDKEMRELGL